MIVVRRCAAAALAVLVGGSLAACGSGTSAQAGGNEVTIRLTDDGCAPQPATKQAGTVTFAVTNAGASKVTEAELLQNGKIVGERENLTPGLSGKFTLNLGAGSFQVYCPNAKQERADFKITGTAQGGWRNNPELVKATQDYKSWVDDQIGQFVNATNGFVAAINAGDMTRAQNLYAPARAFYERVEPVAESFGDLDPDIDGRIDDAQTPADFKGYHKIEQLLFEAHDINAAKAFTGELVSNVNKLKTLADKENYQPAQIANGATSLIDEVQKSKVTGEEERYSHTDLSDFQANLDGAMKAIAVLTPALQKSAPDVLKMVNQRYQAVEQGLAQYVSKPGYLSSGYVDYAQVDKDKQRTLSQSVNALGEALSQVAAKVA